MELTTSASLKKARSPGFFVMLALLLVILASFFYGVFLPGRTLFSNDGPLARLVTDSHKLPERFTGCWLNLNSVGYREPAAMPDISYGLLLLLKPVAFSKFYVIVALTVLGLGAWCFFRQSGLAPPACILGGLAAVFNSNFFSDACWGTAGHCIAIGMIFFAFAALVDTSSPRRWLRVILAGLAVGMAVTEGADFGAIFSVYVAAFIVYWGCVEAGPRGRRVAAGVGRTALVAVCAAILSAQAISELVATDVIDVTTPKHGASDEAARWDWATQWSLPKQETLSMVMPGLFGYRSDTPNGGCYWGTIGRDATWLRYDANGGTGPKPDAIARYTGGGFYAGVTVLLAAFWAGFQTLRRKRSVFNVTERKILWFWMAMGALALLFAFGRYAPFYIWIYRLPYASMIRNPVKFLDVVSFALVVLFGYGVDGLWRRYMSASISPAGRGPGAFKAWWASAGGFEQRWLIGCAIFIVLSLFGWLFYALHYDDLVQYLDHTEIGESLAASIAAFSIRQVGWFILCFALAAGMMMLVFQGRFAGPTARWGAIILGALLVADLGRANLPWIVFWNYQTKYASNPVVDFFRKNPWEHRVAEFPMRTPPQFEPLKRVYRLIWLQQLFPYYNIQSLDFVQLSRLPEDMANFLAALKPTGIADVKAVARDWQLTNTRYVLGAALIPDFLQKSLGADAPPMKIACRFNLVPKPGSVYSINMNQMTAELDTNGQYAVIEIPNVLPRAKLYSNWQVNTNGPDTLKLLFDPRFDPVNTVLVAGDVPPPAPAAATNQDSGTVAITHYAPKDVVLKSDAPAATVLLLNDRCDQDWRVAVDGKRQPLLRCNYLMRGVYLQPGAHTIEFTYRPSIHALYVSLAALGVGMTLLGVVVIAERNAPTPMTATAPAPVTVPTPRPVPIPAPKPPPAKPPASPPVSSKNKKRGRSRR